MYIFLIYFEKFINFVIQDRTWGLYMRVTKNNRVKATDLLKYATKFKIIPVGENPIDFAIMDKKTKLVLDYSGSGPKLIAYPYHGGSNQLFKFNLDENGFWQIINGDNKYLYFNFNSMNSFRGIRYDKNLHHGFKLFQDNGYGAFPYMRNDRKGLYHPEDHIRPTYPEGTSFNNVRKYLT